MKASEYSKLGLKGRIGISVSDSLEAIESVEVHNYATFDIKRLSKASSFIILDEIFYIAKKNPIGKPQKIYFVYRVEDKRLVCTGSRDKAETISVVMRKYHQYN